MRARRLVKAENLRLQQWFCCHALEVCVQPAENIYSSKCETQDGMVAATNTTCTSWFQSEVIHAVVKFTAPVCPQYTKHFVAHIIDCGVHVDHVNPMSKTVSNLAGLVTD